VKTHQTGENLSYDDIDIEIRLTIDGEDVPEPVDASLSEMLEQADR
jgi:hypothetical protein